MANETKVGAEIESIGTLRHVPLMISVLLGTCTIPIAEVLKLGVGSVIELDRAVDQPVDLLVNGQSIARGEIVAVEDSFGLRITELLGL